MTELSPEEMHDIRTCVDRKALPKVHSDRMALVKGSLWNAGDAIRVTFLDGDPSVQKRVENVALEWLDYANLRLLFVDEPDAEIRISFKEEGSWSYIGTDCKGIATDQPTMNYGWLTPDSDDEEVRRVVLHEFGHALGAIHEHQNPAGGIHWNKKVVYAYYEGPPNNWSKEDVDHNLFEVYEKDLTVHTDTDKDSIMMYPIDARFTTDGYSAGFNTTLSGIDKRFMEQNYPASSS